MRRLSKRLSGVERGIEQRVEQRVKQRIVRGVVQNTGYVVDRDRHVSVCPAAYAEEETGTGMDELIDAQAGSETEEIGRQVDKYAGSGLSELIEGYDPMK